MVRGFNRSRGPITVLLAALLLVGVLPVRSNAQRTNVQKTNAQRPNAQRQFAFRTLPVSPPRNTIPLASSCPNQGGILDSISVPVSYPLELAVVSFVPAPKGEPPSNCPPKTPRLWPPETRNSRFCRR